MRPTSSLFRVRPHTNLGQFVHAGLDEIDARELLHHASAEVLKLIGVVDAVPDQQRLGLGHLPLAVECVALLYRQKASHGLIHVIQNHRRMTLGKLLGEMEAEGEGVPVRLVSLALDEVSKSKMRKEFQHVVAMRRVAPACRNCRTLATDVQSLGCAHFGLFC